MVSQNQIDTFNRFYQVSRETILSLNKYEEMLLSWSKKLNLIGNSTNKHIWTRHFLDSAQVIDFIDKNTKEIVDIGTGAGFPGLIISIIAKDKKIPLKTKLIEKSPKKIIFLKEVINELKLGVEVLNENVLLKSDEFVEETFVTRAFKPLDTILELIHKRAKNFNFFFIFLGKSGDEQLLHASKSWDIQYKKRMSITNKDSFILEVNKLKKK